MSTHDASRHAVSRRRALEALRAGVPNRDAVVSLGSMQVGVEDRFSLLLDAVRAQSATAGQEASAPGGVLVGGGFGSGKSHVLEHLAHVAMSEGFVVSKVVISKETPLHDPAKLFRAAIEAAKVPGRPGSAIDEVALALAVDSPAYADLYRWAHGEDVPVDSRFAATLFLHEYARGDEEFRDRIIRFWAGDPLPVADLRRRLRETGAAATYRLASARERDLSIQRFRFVSRLMRAAGWQGWVLLIDEVELIGRYSLLQRARSYAEVTRWVRGDRDDPGAPIAAVLTTVDDFETQVLEGKNDLELIPKRLRAKQTAESEVLAGLAESGMRIMGHDQLALQPPGQAELDRTYAELRTIHGQAYQWEPPDIAGLERLPSNRMRQYVRAWINEWDLRRLDGSYRPEITATELAVELRDEEPGEGPGEDSAMGEPGTAGAG